MAIDIQIKSSEGDLDSSAQDNPARQILETQDIAQFTELPKIGEYMEFKREKAFEKLNDIKMYLIMKGKFDQKAYENTALFINNIFDIYEGKESFEKIFGVDLSETVSAFVVPARGEFPQEARRKIEVAKDLDPLNNHRERYLFRELLANVCPFVLTMYEETDSSGNKKVVGLGMYSPQNLNLLQDTLEFATNYKVNAIRNPLAAFNTLKNLPGAILEGGVNKLGKRAITGKLFAEATASVNETIATAQRITKGNIQVSGLGAILPVVTELGKNVDMERLRKATTGHLNTIAAMYLKFLHLIKIDEYDKDSKLNLGITGIGYIGNAIANLILENAKKIENFPKNIELFIYDINYDKAIKRARELEEKYGAKVTICKNADELQNNTFINIAAPTGKTKLIKDSKGKITIDDSEPFSEDGKEKYDNGGAVVKPVWNTKNIKNLLGEQISIRRIGPNYNYQKDQLNNENTDLWGQYNYGYVEGEEGFGPGLRPDSMFGCEFEALMAGMAVRSGTIDLNTIIHTDWVSPEDAMVFINRYLYVLQTALPEGFEGGGVDVTERIYATRHIRNPKLVIEA